MKYATLWTLTRLPFLSTLDLAILQGISGRGARAQLTRLCQDDMAAYVELPGTREHLYYATGTGLEAAAASAREDAHALAARYGLSERALLRRLPGLDRLVAGRRVLIALHLALVAAGGALEDWQAGPVRWRAVQRTGGYTLDLDGEATLVWPAPGERYRVGYVWDGDRTIPTEGLHERLGRLETLRRALAHRLPAAIRVPPVLLVTTDAARVPPGYRPGVLWTTAAEIAARGPLEAPWRGGQLRGVARPLRDALAAQGQPPSPAPILRAAPFPIGGADAPRLAERAQALRDGTAPAGSEGLALLSYALPPRALALLALVGAHPLFAAVHLERVCPLARSDRAALLALLCRHALLAVWQPPLMDGERRYVLTPRGLHVLALHAGMMPQTFRRCHGMLENSAAATRTGLPFLQGTLAHTDAIHECYLAFQQGARDRGGILWWRGDWACQRTYPDGERICTLRPDAAGVYRDTAGYLSFYLEADRGTTGHRKVEQKLARYYAYRASCPAVAPTTLLLVAPGARRCWEVLRRIEELAVACGTAPLDVRATTLDELRGQGPWAPIWRTAQGTCGPLALAPTAVEDAVTPDEAYGTDARNDG